MIEQFRKSGSEGFAGLITDTGIGDAFGQAMTKFKEAFGIVNHTLESKVDTTNTILGSINGAITVVANNTAKAVTGGQSIVNSAGQSIYGGDIPGTVSSAPSSLLNLGTRVAAGWMTGTRYNTQTGQYDVYRQAEGPSTSTGQGPGMGWGAALTDWQKAASKKSSNTAAYMGMGIEGAMTGYSTYSSARAGGIPQGQSIAAGVMGAGATIAMGVSAGVGAGALGSAGSSGAFTLLGMGPVGWLILAAVFAIGAILLSTMGGKKSTQSSSESKTSEAKVSSKIDVTNKQLEIVNRNLVALRNSITTYILPSSAYFAEKFGLDEEFSINARRGLL
jgi:hypothetical protein